MDGMDDLKVGDAVRMTVAPGWSGVITEILDHDEQVMFRRDDEDGVEYQFRADMFAKV